jgi:hypothetical protein
MKVAHAGIRRSDDSLPCEFPRVGSVRKALETEAVNAKPDRADARTGTKPALGLQRGVTVASRSQLDLPGVERDAASRRRRCRLSAPPPPGSTGLAGGRKAGSGRR